MNIERFRKIIEYSAKNRKEMESEVRRFYSLAGISADKDVLNIMQIVRPIFRKRDFWF